MSSNPLLRQLLTSQVATDATLQDSHTATHGLTSSSSSTSSSQRQQQSRVQTNARRSSQSSPVAGPEPSLNQRYSPQQTDSCYLSPSGIDSRVTSSNNQPDISLDPRMVEDSQTWLADGVWQANELDFDRVMLQTQEAFGIDMSSMTMEELTDQILHNQNSSNESWNQDQVDKSNSSGSFTSQANMDTMSSQGLTMLPAPGFMRSMAASGSRVQLSSMYSNPVLQYNNQVQAQHGSMMNKSPNSSSSYKQQNSLPTGNMAEQMQFEKGRDFNVEATLNWSGDRKQTEAYIQYPPDDAQGQNSEYTITQLTNVSSRGFYGAPAAPAKLRQSDATAVSNANVQSINASYSLYGRAQMGSNMDADASPSSQSNYSNMSQYKNYNFSTQTRDYSVNQLPAKASPLTLDPTGSVEGSPAVSQQPSPAYSGYGPAAPVSSSSYQPQQPVNQMSVNSPNINTRGDAQEPSRRQNTEQILKSCGLYEPTMLTAQLVRKSREIDEGLSDFKSQLDILMRDITNNL